MPTESIPRVTKKARSGAKTQHGIRPARYATPPVIEALAEFYFSGSEWDLTLPGILYEQLRTKYPERRQLEHLEVELRAETADTRISQRSPRAQFVSEDKGSIVQLEQDLLVANRLQPYPGYDTWRAEVLGLLEIYLGFAKPSAIKRVGVRYINRVVIPHEEIDLKDYFHLYADVPVELGSPHGDFLVRVHSNPPLHSEHQLITSFGSSPSQATHSTLLLDFYDTIGSMDQPQITLESAAGLLDDAHENIEYAFESCITEKTRNLFGPKSEVSQ